jgi:hypothetical protein
MSKLTEAQMEDLMASLDCGEKIQSVRFGRDDEGTIIKAVVQVLDDSVSEDEAEVFVETIEDDGLIESEGSLDDGLEGEEVPVGPKVIVTRKRPKATMTKEREAVKSLVENKFYIGVEFEVLAPGAIHFGVSSAWVRQPSKAEREAMKAAADKERVEMG